MNAIQWQDYVRAAFVAPGPEYWPGYAGLLFAILLLAALIYWLVSRNKKTSLEVSLALVSYERLTHVVLPKADDGEIHIDHILLTDNGIFVVDAKDIRGVVFGGDRMQDWTVMDQGRRYTIANPQATLFDRVAAVKQIVRDIPVEGRIVFGAQADFSKGVPSYVCTEQQLLAELPRVSGRSGSQPRTAFYLQWQTLRDAAFDGTGLEVTSKPRN